MPTIGGVSWHIGWWWTVTLDHAQGRAPRDRGEIEWPGGGRATIEWLRGLHDRRQQNAPVLRGWAVLRFNLPVGGDHRADPGLTVAAVITVCAP
jgi:hypothetical protein